MTVCMSGTVAEISAAFRATGIDGGRGVRESAANLGMVGADQEFEGTHKGGNRGARCAHHRH